MKRGRPKKFELRVDAHEARVPGADQTIAVRRPPVGCGEPEAICRPPKAGNDSDRSTARGLARRYRIGASGSGAPVGWAERSAQVGRRRTPDDEQIAACSSEGAPPNATHWSVRGVAAETGVSKSTAATPNFSLFGLQPHLSSAFMGYHDTVAFLWKKVRAHCRTVALQSSRQGSGCLVRVGPERVMIPLERLAQPVLPMGWATWKGVTTTTPPRPTTRFAALDVQSGQVITNANGTTVIKSFLCSGDISMRTCPPARTSIWYFRQSRDAQNTPRSVSGASAPAYHLHFTQPIRPGSIRSNAGWPHHQQSIPPRLLSHRQGTDPAHWTRSSDTITPTASPIPVDRPADSILRKSSNGFLKVICGQQH